MKPTESNEQAPTMTQIRRTPSTREWLLKHRNEYVTRADCIKACHVITGVGIRNARRRMKSIEDAERGDDLFENIQGVEPIIQVDEEQGIASMSLISQVPKTPEELIAMAGLDTKVWEVSTKKENVINFWGNEENPNYQIKVWFTRAVSELAENYMDGVLEEMKEFTPVYPKLTYPNISEQNMLEIALFDLHIGSLTWGVETGDDYDLKIALNRFTKAGNQILNYARVFPITQIVLPIGNDMFNSNNSLGMTMAGTPQDEDSRWWKVYIDAFRVMVTFIDTCQNIAPVKIVVVPGNHDQEKIMYFGHSLKSWYRNCESVTVDTGPEPYKFVTFGKNLIGYTHGKEIKQDRLPLLMATEVPALWANSVHRSWHLGHLHHRKTSVYLPLASFNGVTVRILPSLAGRDSWHKMKGFSSVKEAVGLIWHETQGNIAEYSFNVCDTIV